MTAATMQGPDRPGRRIRHSWRCARNHPVAEAVRTDPTGQAYVVEQCTGCEGDDLHARLADRLNEETP